MGPADPEDAERDIKDATSWLGLFAALWVVGGVAQATVSLWVASNAATPAIAACLLLRRPNSLTALFGFCAAAPTIYMMLRAAWIPLEIPLEGAIVRFFVTLFCFYAARSLLRVQVAVRRFPGLRPRFGRPRLRFHW